MAEENYKNDSRYKKYQAAIEKTLQSFESVGEWADIISFLNRLSKVIPEKILVNKRLAQCLNPNLPGGVHQKALEVYDTIFSKITPDLFFSDLGMYTMGLFPLFEHAATMVKSSLLNLFEKHFIPVQNLPCLPSLILSILPGLEDETAEHFSRVYEMLVSLKLKYPNQFYHIIWSLLATTSKHRVAIVNFLSRDLPSGPHSKSEHELICGGNPKMTSVALINSLKDKNILVVRGVLDLMISHFPIELGCFTDQDLLKLTKEALLVLLRRDMSLTRRYYLWSSPDDHCSERSVFLQSGAFDILLGEMSGDGELSLELIQKPYKLVIFLMDKPSIANPILKKIFLKMVISLQQATSNLKDLELIEKALSCANLFFDNVELDLAWSEILNMTSSSLSDDKNSDTLPNFLRFCVEKIDLCDDEAKSIHLPMLLVLLSHSMSHRSAQLSNENKSHIWRLFNDVLQIVLLKGNDCLHTLQIDKAPPLSQAETLSMINEFMARGELALDSISGSFWLHSVFHSVTLANLTFKSSLEINSEILPDALIMNEAFASTLNHAGQLLLSESELTMMLDEVRNWTKYILSFCLGSREPSVWEMVIISIVKILDISRDLVTNSESFVSKFLPVFWRFSLDFRPCLNQSSVILLQLHLWAPDMVENFISVSISKGLLADRINSVSLFTYIWTLAMKETRLEGTPFPKVVFQIIDLVQSPIVGLNHGALKWLQSSIDLIPSIFDLMFTVIAESLPCIENDGTYTPEYTKCFNIAQLEYIMRLMALLLTTCDLPLFDLLEEKKIPSVLELTMIDSIPTRFTFDSPNNYSYLSFIAQVTLPFMCATAPAEFSDSAKIQTESLKKTVYSLLSIILSRDSQELTIKELIPIAEAVLIVLDKSVSAELFSHTPYLLNIAGLLFGLRNELLPAPKAYSAICCQAIEKIQDFSVLKIWIEFSLKITEAEGEVWADFVDPLLSCLAQKLSSERNGNSFETLLMCQNIIFGIEQLAMVGIALASVAEKIPLVKSKPRRFETFRNALVRNASSVHLQIPSADLINIVSKSLQKPLLELGTSWKQTRDFVSLSNLSKTLSETLARLYSVNPSIILTSIVSLWAIPENRDPLSLLCNFEESPLADDFFRNFLHIYRPVIRDGTVDYSLDVLLDFLSRIAEASINSTVMIDLGNLVNIITKDIMGNPNGRAKASVPRLICFSTRVLKVLLADPQSKKVGRETLDSYQKLIEFSVITASKLVDPSLWTEWPAIAADKNDMSLSYYLGQIKRACKEPLCFEIYIILIQEVLPSAPVLLTDQDKYIAFISMVWNSLILPVIKGSIRKHFPGLLGTFCLISLTEQAHLSGKVWKREFIDSIFDLQFFVMPASYLQIYYAATTAIVKIDPERLADFLGKTSSSGPAIFLSRDIEFANRVTLTKRLCFALLCSEPRFILQHISGIQEKVVEVIRLNAGQYCAEIFLLWQILLFKVGSDNLLGLWPVILTEMISVLEALLAVQRERPPKDLTLTFIHLCKSVDLTMLLSPSSILLYSWNIIRNPSSDNIYLSLLEKVCRKYSLPINDFPEAMRLPSNYARPVLCGKIVEFAEIAPFCAYTLQLSPEMATLRLVQKIDYISVEQSILSDFLETVGDQ